MARRTSNSSVGSTIPTDLLPTRTADMGSFAWMINIERTSGTAAEGWAGAETVWDVAILEDVATGGVAGDESTSLGPSFMLHQPATTVSVASTAAPARIGVLPGFQLRSWLVRAQVLLFSVVKSAAGSAMVGASLSLVAASSVIGESSIKLSSAERIEIESGSLSAIARFAHFDISRRSSITSSTCLRRCSSFSPAISETNAPTSGASANGPNARQAWINVARRSLAVGQRCSTSCVIAQANALSTASGTSGRTLRMRGGGSDTIFNSAATSSSMLKRRCWASNSHATTPDAHTSHRRSNGFPNACSGDM